MSSKLLSVVVPVYNEEDCIIIFINKLLEVLNQHKYNYEVVFIDDGSLDNTVQLIRNVSQKNKKIKIYELSYNHGKPLALTAGLHLSKGDLIILMDPDLQDPPEDIPRFLDKLNSGYDLVMGTRKSKKDSLVNVLFSKLFWRSLEIFTGLKIPKNLAVMRALNREFANRFKNYGETNRFIEGIFIKIGMRQTHIEIENRSRVAGQSKFTFKKKVNLAIDAILSHSDLPLRLTVRIGLFTISLAFLAAITLAYLRLYVMKFQLGWPSLFVLNTMGFGFVILFLGVIGTYVGAIFEETKQRPLFSLKQNVSQDEHEY